MWLSIFVVVIGFLTNITLAFIFPSAVQPCSQWHKEALTIAGNGSPDDSSSQLSSPHQIAMDKSGKLFIYDTDNERIQTVDNGSIYTWDHSDRELRGNCLFVDDHGTLYIETGYMTPIIRWTSNSISAEETRCQLSGCTDMFVDSTTNDIYVTQYYEHRVIKCTPDGTQTVVAGMAEEHGNSSNKLFHPRGLFVDEETKDIFVADSSNNRIQKWPRNAKEGITVHSIRNPYNLIKDKNNVLYVSQQNRSIVRINSNTQRSEVIPGVTGISAGSSSKNLDNAVSFVFDHWGNLFVSDQHNHRIHKFLINNSKCSPSSLTVTSPKALIIKQDSSLETPTPRRKPIDDKILEHMSNMKLELSALRQQLERQQTQCKGEAKDGTYEFAPPNIRWCPWKSDTCVRQLERRGQGAISITQHQPVPFELILSDSTSLNASHHILKLVVNSDRVTISNSTRILIETNNIKDTLHATESGSHTYWLSVHAFELSIKYGQGEVRDKLTILKYEVNETERSGLGQLQYLHLILNKTTELDAIADLRDKIDIFIGVQPVVIDPPLFIVPRSPTGDSKIITDGKYTLPSRLPVPNQQLYNDVTDWELNDLSFPDFIAAIERSVEDDEGWCYKMLRSKVATFDQSNLLATYLRITMGHHQGLSPGVPYVLEIWPAHHYSPVHKHSNSYGVIRVLHGKLSVKLYASLNIHHQDSFIESLLEPGNVTWLSPGLNQVHKILNPTDKVSITIQAYQYGETDRDHYEFFDYINKTGKDTISGFFPKRDEDFNTFKRIIQKEWNQYRYGKK